MPKEMNLGENIYSHSPLATFTCSDWTMLCIHVYSVIMVGDYVLIVDGPHTVVRGCYMQTRVVVVGDFRRTGSGLLRRQGGLFSLTCTLDKSRRVLMYYKVVV